VSQQATDDIWLRAGFEQVNRGGVPIMPTSALAA
jgi:hypothetical protein